MTRQAVLTSRAAHLRAAQGLIAQGSGSWVSGLCHAVPHGLQEAAAADAQPSRHTVTAPARSFLPPSRTAFSSAACLVCMRTTP